jgi:RNA polymerase sigma-70 factor (ECF subfamily)
MTWNDADLIQRWQHGEASAFEALVRRWQQPLGRFLFRLVGQEELAKDLCQEVFLRVYHARARYQQNGAFSTWIYRIALNVARDALRRGRRLPSSLNHQDIAAPDAPAETQFQQRELAQVLADCLAELPEPLREVLILRHYEEMSFEGIARLTGTPASTWKSRFTAALGRLRTRLRQLGWDEEEDDR